MSIFITGGAGFIGSNFILQWAAHNDEPIINLDKLTYAGNPANLQSLDKPEKYILVQGDICDREKVDSIFNKYRPRAVLNFAAESHVDRSIHGPEDFIKTNVFGTFTLLEAARTYYGTLSEEEKQTFRFLHVSTDEVYGSLGPDEAPFSENNQYAPNSPYSASKASSDHLVRAYFHTYGLPCLTSNCSNNYGPFQFPEKLIPLMILNAGDSKPLPIYGDGRQVRDWLEVSDHCAALETILQHGRPGEVYNIGGDQEKANIDVVHNICDLMDEMSPRSDGHSYREQICHIKDRPGHDRRYAINATKIKNELGWKPKFNFKEGLRKTVSWYLKEKQWVENVRSGTYRDWIEKHYNN